MSTLSKKSRLGRRVVPSKSYMFCEATSLVVEALHIIAARSREHCCYGGRLRLTTSDATHKERQDDFEVTGKRNREKLGIASKGNQELAA